MLNKILINNFALIDSLSVDFESGLSILTGETGAGKSIIIDAVSLVLGAKAEKGMIRSGKTKAYIEAAFSLPENAAFFDCLNEEGIDFDEDDEIILSREITLNGKNLCRVNGVMVQLSSLKRISSFLMEIHGQHDYQALLNNDNHRQFLDNLGDDSYSELFQKVVFAYEILKKEEFAYKQVQEEVRLKEEKLIFLNHQFKELNSAKLKKGEIEEIKDKITKLRNYDKIEKSLKVVYESLYGDTLSKVDEAKLTISKIADLSENYKKMEESLESIYFELEDIALSARDCISAFDSGGESLDILEERLNALRRIEKKYLCTVEEAIDKLEFIKSEIKRFEDLDISLDETAKKYKKAQESYKILSKNLSDERFKLASKVQNDINNELHSLNMKAADFVIDIQNDENLISKYGSDKIKFIISANKGEDYKELSKTASGGELSRIMLAIKTVSASKVSVPSMVFDEIDSGISGDTAQIVAQKLALISKYHQVLCITHMHQLAAIGKQHYKVSKTVIDDRTYTSIKKLDEEDRVIEISRILGQSDSAKLSSIEHARNLLLDGNKFRELYNS